MSDTIRLIAEFFAACVGTIAFALLFQVPRKYYLYCGEVLISRRSLTRQSRTFVI